MTFAEIFLESLKVSHLSIRRSTWAIEKSSDLHHPTAYSLNTYFYFTNVTRCTSDTYAARIITEPMPPGLLSFHETTILFCFRSNDESSLTVFKEA